MAKKAAKVPVKRAKQKSQAAAKPAAKAPAKGPAPAPAEGAMMHTMQSLRDDIDRAFERFFQGWPSALAFPRSLWEFDPLRELGSPFGLGRFGLAPRTDIREADKSYEITVELPGVQEKDLGVTVSDNRLTVRGEKKAEREEKGKGHYLSERGYGAFERSFRLPDDVDADKISADFQSGVLKLTLPRKAGAKAKQRKVAIKAK